MKAHSVYKVVTYVPEKCFEEFSSSLLSTTFDTIGKYTNCMSWSSVTSTWTPSEGANPFIGTIGEKSVEKEVRLEIRCTDEEIKNLLSLIRENHPYEEAEIDVFPMLTDDMFL